MRILIIEDDPDMRRILQVRLEHRGHTVELMPSGFGSTNRVGGRGYDRPSVVILDGMLPGLSAPQLLAMWAQDESARDVPVLLFSAADEPLLQQWTALHPRCSALSKGVGVRALVEAVERLGAESPTRAPA